MVVDALGPSVHVNQPVDGGKLAAEEFLTLGEVEALHATDVVDWDDALGAWWMRRWWWMRRYG